MDANIISIIRIMKKILNDFLAKAAFLQLLFPPHKWDGNEFARFKPGFYSLPFGFSQRLIEINKIALASNL